MRKSAFFLGFFFLLASGELFAQLSRDSAQEIIRRFVLDSGIRPLPGHDKVFTLDDGPKLGLENLLGLSKEHAMAIIAHFDHYELTAHPLYPFIQDVIVITNMRRWDLPVTLYVFIDSSDEVCRMNYVLGPPAGITVEEAHRVFSKLTISHISLDHVPDKDWEITGWQETDRAYLFSWQKGIPIVKPSYLMTLKSYQQEHLLPFMKKNKMPHDGIFTPTPIVKPGYKSQKN